MRKKSKRGGKKMDQGACALLPNVKVSYSVDIKVSGKDPTKGEVNGQPASFYLGFWNDMAAYGSSKVDVASGKGEFTLSLYENQTDTLKLELLAEFCDTDSGLSKPFPLDASFACMRQLCSGKPVDVVMKDPFMDGNVCKLTLQADTPVNHLFLKRSALWDVNSHNRSLESMSNDILKKITLNNLHVPAASEPFNSGITFLAGGGNESLGVESVQTNYAVLNKYIMSSERTLPLGLLCVQLQQTLFNHGHTITEALEMDDPSFAKFLGSVLGGGTEDAGMQPYESDLTLGQAMTFDFCCDPPVQYTLAPVMTENIGTCMAASQFINRVYPDALRVDPSGGKFMLNDRNMVEHYSELFGREWTPFQRSVNTDDCETQFYAQQMTARTVILSDVSVGALKKGCSGLAILSKWTPECYEGASKFYSRAKDLLVSGKITIANAIGLAGGASAAAASDSASTQDKIDNMKNLNGHCFGVLRYQGAQEDDLYVRLLEGTTSSKPYRCHKDTAYYTASNGTVMLRFDQLLTQLGYSIMKEAQVCNRVLGEEPDGTCGWAGPRDIACMRRTTMVIPCLHSDNIAAGKTYKKMAQSCKLKKAGKTDSPVCIPFYQWCIFTGLQCDETSVGCMPVDEDEYRDEKRLGAGCRPGELAKKSLKAVNAGLGADMVEIGKRIFDEVMPPVASEATFKRVMNTWSELRPLKDVNKQVAGMRQQGVRYETVAVMESPCHPELTPCLYQIKRKLADKFNAINKAASPSDGAFITVDYTATGVSMVVHAEDRSHVLTALSSMQQAKKELGWPSNTSHGSGAKISLK